MACNNWLPISLDCIEDLSGIDTIYSMKHSNLDTSSLTNGFTVNDTAHTITAIALSSSATTDLFQEIQVAENSSNFVENRRFVLENGRAGWEVQLTAQIPKNDGISRYQLDNMTKSRNLIIVKDNNGRYFCLGFRRGGYWNSGSLMTGTAVDDFGGAGIVFTSYEQHVVYEMDSSIINAIINAA